MKEIKDLENSLRHHKNLYYAGTPEIDDSDYDSLEDKLRKLDPENLVLKMVGSIQNNNKVKHDSKMLSLGKTYKAEELESWIGEHEVISMFKIDGVSCSLIYEDGVLLVAKTRGDGNQGEDITAKVLWMESVPQKINLKERIEIRGEMYCDEDSFFKLGEEMSSLDLDRPTSMRNIVAGLVGRKENISLCRHIHLMAFELISHDKNIGREVDKIKILNSLGFKAVETQVHKDKKEIKETLNKAALFMSEGHYQIDGLVFVYNDLIVQNELGETAHHPRYKMAFKFAGESKETKILDIVWSVSRNGILTPVAEVEVVDLGGAKISRVTLHNYGMVKQHGLKKGDKIRIIRSGEVIPKFLEKIEASASPFEIPKQCPSCKEETQIVDIRIFCKNDLCPGRLKEEILNFIQKIGIDDLSSKRLDEMMKKGLVKSIPDIYRLKKDELLELDKVKEKLANKFIDNIENSKSANLVTFLSALGISGGAYNKCEKVVLNGFDTIEKIKKLDVEKLMEVDSFAEKSAVDFLKSLDKKRGLINELLTLGFEFNEVEKIESEISSKKICITGSLSEKRSIIEGNIRNAGGIVVTSVSKNTDFLLCNDQSSNSSKLKKAATLDIKIITESDLSSMLGL